jgi:hypothetical protein
MAVHNNTGEYKTYTPPEAATFRAKIQEVFQVDERKTDEIFAKLFFYGLTTAGVAMAALNLLASLR